MFLLSPLHTRHAFLSRIGGGQISFQIQRSTGRPVATAILQKHKR